MQNHLFKNFSESLNTQIPQVYLDMDGVLADFFGYFDKITGKDYKELNGNQVLFNELSKKFIEGTDFFAKIPAHRSLSLIMSTIKLIFGKYNILSSSDFVTPRIIYLYDFVNYSKGEVKHLDLIDKLINNGTSNNEILKSEIIKYFNYLNDNENINTELLFNCQRHDLHENLMLLSLEELIAFYKSLEN